MRNRETDNELNKATELSGPLMGCEMLRAVEQRGLVRRTMVRVLVTRESLVLTDDPA